MLSVGCNDGTHNGTKGTPCAGFQSLLEQRGQFALWCENPVIPATFHDVWASAQVYASVPSHPWARCTRHGTGRCGCENTHLPHRFALG